ncbi:MAG: transcriptional regulator, Fis family [Polaromonas sp.]|nr:transcriptional regulator, Fis family [Polaromonas sp.]
MTSNSALTTKLVAWAVITSSLLLAACSESTNSGVVKTAEPTGISPASVAALAAQATGFAVGSQMSARTAYVFFDAQCSHCGDLWNAAKPLKSQIKLVWIPVGIINAASTSQGATLLAAADPVAEMEKHEASLLGRQGGISSATGIDAQKAAVAKNTELMGQFGLTSIPAIVGTNSQTGAMVRQEGAMPTAALAKLLGLDMPPQQMIPAGK